MLFLGALAMRIAHITYSYQPITGGADVWIELLRAVCAKAGHDTIVYQRWHDHVTDPGVRCLRPPSWAPAARAEFWTLPFSLLSLRSELCRYDVLVVHYPNYHRFVEWHPRTVLVSHGVFWDDRPGALRSRIKRALARRAYRTATAVVANDTFFLREMGVPVLPGHTPFTEVAPLRFYVPNCVDTDRFRRTDPHPALGAEPVILVPRNLYRNRGVHLAIDAFALCARDLAPAQLVVVGREGQPGYGEECRSRAYKVGLAERVTFAGPIPWQEMPAVYSAAELTVIPTVSGEGTSLAALESMACGTATVTTNVAGLADLPSLQCAPTASALAEAMVRTWANRAAIGAQQQAAVRSTFHLGNWSAIWLRILEDVAALPTDRDTGLRYPSA